MSKRKAFTLIEVLISIALLSLVMLALYKSMSIQRISNKKVHQFLDKTMATDKMIMVLYNDILRSNGVFKMQKAKMGPFCMEETSNSLYGLSKAKVCWLVGKNDDTLTRIEGNDYKLPIRSSKRVEADLVAKGVKIFSVTRKRDKTLVVLQLAGEEPYTFVVYGIEEPKKPKPKPKKKKTRAKKPATTTNKDTNNSKTNPVPNETNMTREEP